MLTAKPWKDDTKTLTKASGWQATFTKLPGIKDGKKIEVLSSGNKHT